MLTLFFWLLLWVPDTTTPTSKLTIGSSAPSVLAESTLAVKKTKSGTLTTLPRSKSSTAGLGHTEEKESTEKLSIWALLLIIVPCGLLGGTWNYLRTYDTVTAATPDETDPSSRLTRHWQTCLLGGVIAGGIVPFLLISTSSKLLEAPSTYHYFVFGAYCLAAAVSSAAFIEAAASSLVKRLQVDLKQTKQALAMTTAQTIQLQENINQTQQALVTTTQQTEKLRDKANKLESIAITLHGIQHLANPAVAADTEQKQQFNQQMQVLSDQLNSVKD